MKMKRTNIYLPDEMHTELMQISKDRDIKFTELVRHAIKDYLPKLRKQKDAGKR
jgi:metal-responsive CopG/Arc/MetJ family transcriptional regulator